MVKLASARESRTYGPRLSRKRAEYTNAGLYLFGTVVLVSGFVAQLSNEPKSGLALLLIGLALLIVVNVHDLVAHLAGIDFHFSLMGFDAQLALVEFAVPVVQTAGTLLYFAGILFLFIQVEKGDGYFKVEKPALSLLIAGPVLWLLGSIHNSCQVYQRADSHSQILQQSVLIPFLMGSLLFLVGSILNSQEQSGPVHHGLELLGWNWVWLGIAGSLLFFIGGLANAMKVFKFQQDGGMPLEKLRGGAQERLVHEREGQVPFILEAQRRRRKECEETQVLMIREEERRRRRKEAEESILVEEHVKVTPPVVAPTPYKDVLLGDHNHAPTLV